MNGIGDLLVATILGFLVAASLIYVITEARAATARRERRLAYVVVLLPELAGDDTRDPIDVAVEFALDLDAQALAAETEAYLKEQTP